MLQVKNLWQIFAQKTILHSMYLDVTRGQIAALLGPNGAGKTTLLKTIMGLYPRAHTSHQTSIMLDTHDITDLPPSQRVAYGLAYVPQFSSLFQSMSVHDNLCIVYHYHPFWKNKKKNVFEDEYHELMDRMDMSNTKEQKALLLSGGQKRKVEVIRAILMHPSIIMLDEPFAGVDPKSMYELKELFITLTRNNIGVMISDHYVDQLLSIATVVYVVMDGRIITSGTKEEVMKNTELKHGYLGEQFHQEVTRRFLD